MSDYVITGAVAQYSLDDPGQIPLSLGGFAGNVAYPTPGYFSPTTDSNPTINVIVTLTFVGTINFPATISAQATSTSATGISWTQIVPESVLLEPDPDTGGLPFTVTAQISPTVQPTAIFCQNYLATVTDDDGRTEVFNVGISNTGGYPAAKAEIIDNYPDPAAFASTPGAPTSLAATPASGTQMNLSWSAPANTGSAPIIGYQISRETPIGSGFYVIIANTGSTSTSTSDFAVLPGVTYNYQVAAINAIGIGALSNAASGTTPQTAPFAPEDLAASAVSNAQIDLAWVAPAVTGGSAITGYQISRESPIGGGFAVLVADTGTTAVTYSDMTVAASTQYNYKVAAINAIGTGPDSNESAATTPA